MGAARTRRPTPHAFVVPIVAKVFQDLDVTATVWQTHDRWRELYERSSVLEFELEHGREAARFAYNAECIAAARRTKRSVLGRHAGFADLWVPISVAGRTDAVLVAGPFATERPTGAVVLDRWRELSGRQGHPSDPDFSRYLSSTVSTLVLEGERAAMFQRLVELLADLMAGCGPAEATFRQADALHRKLLDSRLAERSWSVAQLMVGARTSRRWKSPLRARKLPDFALTRYPEDAIVGLLVGCGHDTDPVDDRLRRDALQRACVDVGRRMRNVMAGQVGDHGIMYLSSGHRRRALLDLADETSQLARRRFGLEPHFGVSMLPVTLDRQYQAALAAAESALSGRVPVVHATADQPAASPMGRMREELARLVEREPRELPARFERFLETVAVRSGYRLEPARAHVEAGFERMAAVLVDTGTLDAKSLAGLTASLERSAREARTVDELYAAYRLALRDIVDAVENPVPSRQDRSLRRAEAYLRQHYAERFALARVARAAGFAPNYFSQLWKKTRGMTVEGYVTTLRLERAKELLTGSALAVQRVAQLSGFGTRRYLARVFKRATGEAPIAYRRRVGKELTALGV